MKARFRHVTIPLLLLAGGPTSLLSHTRATGLSTPSVSSTSWPRLGPRTPLHLLHHRNIPVLFYREAETIATRQYGTNLPRWAHTMECTP